MGGNKKLCLSYNKSLISSNAQHAIAVYDLHLTLKLKRETMLT